MKKILIPILTILCLGPLPLAAQTFKPAPVDISTEKVSRDGKVYFAHTVLDHQTLFSISRTYGVSYQDIVEANPDIDLSRGQIQTGQVLLIPEKTLSLEAGQTVPSQAPEPAAAAQAQTPAAGADYTIYTAKWYEDLNMIAAKFNIPKETLMAFNGLTSEQLERRQRLRIPNRPVSVPAPAPAPVELAEATEIPAGQAQEEMTGETETGLATTDLPAEEAEPARTGFSLWDLFRRKKISDRISVGIILPFGAKGQVNHSAFDLYSGMLLAVREMAKTGIKADLSVIDSRNPATPVTENALETFDLVIGPISPEELEKTLELCPASTAVVSPLDPKAADLARTHANLIQAPSPADAQYDDIIDWLRSDCLPGDKIVLIVEKGAAPTALGSKLAASGLSYTTLECAYQDRGIADRMQALLPTSRNTLRAVIATEKEAVVNEAVRGLALLAYKGIDAVLYGPSKIRTFDMVEVENLHLAQAHLSCSYFIDYDNPRIKDFLLSYRALFGAEPTQFAYQGYDAANYFIRNFATSERDWERMSRLEDRKYRGLQSDFMIVDEGEAGHVNRAVRRVVFGKDYSVTLLNQ